MASGGSASQGAPMALTRGPHRDGKSDRHRDRQVFLDKHTKSDVSEEWKKVDDRKIAKLRGILAALQEENQSTQLLRWESEDAEARRALEATRANVDARLGACKEQDSRFLKRQAELRRHVLENEKSLQELESNIEKGDRKAREETAESRRLDSEYRQLEAGLNEQEESRATELKRIAQTSQYKKYLEAVVVDFAEDFEGDIEVLMNRHKTLEAGNKELHGANQELTSRLDKVRDECLRVQSGLQNDHLMISSNLHECQVSLDQHRAKSRDLEQQLNRALEEKELKESQVGVIQMAIEQLFTRTVSTCRLKQRKKAMLDAVDTRFAPVRGDKADVRLEEMLKQIVERMEDLKEMHVKAQESLYRADDENVTAAAAEESDVLENVKFVQQRDDRKPGSSHGPGHSGDVSSEVHSAGAANSALRRLKSDESGGSGIAG